MRDEIREILETVRKIEKLLYGNGEEGLCERVRALEKIGKFFIWMCGLFLVNLVATLFKVFAR